MLLSVLLAGQRVKYEPVIRAHKLVSQNPVGKVLRRARPALRGSDARRALHIISFLRFGAAIPGEASHRYRQPPVLSFALRSLVRQNFRLRARLPHTSLHK